MRSGPGPHDRGEHADGAPGPRGDYDSVDVSAPGSLKAIKAAHSKAILGSIGGHVYALKALAANDPNWKFTIPYPFEAMGATAVQTAVSVGRGEPVQSKVIIPVQPVISSSNAAGVLAGVEKALAAAPAS